MEGGKRHARMAECHESAGVMRRLRIHRKTVWRHDTKPRPLPYHAGLAETWDNTGRLGGKVSSRLPRGQRIKTHVLVGRPDHHGAFRSLAEAAARQRQKAVTPLGHQDLAAFWV